MPSVLEKRRVKQLIFSCVSAVIIVVAAIILRDAKLLFALFVSLYAAYQAVMIGVRYRGGQILEVVMICTSVSKAFVNDRLRVTFRTAQDEEDNDAYSTMFEFTVPGKSRFDQFVVGAPYVIYLDKSSPHVLLDYFPC